MPDKRNVSKQRRAARNRQTRDALAARRDNAVPAPPSAPTSTSGAGRTSGLGGGSRATGASGRAAPARRGTRPRPVFVASQPPDPGLKGVFTSNRPGDRWVLAAFLLAIVSAVVSLLAVGVAVDDRGEVLPYQFAALTVAAREAVTGRSVDGLTESMLEAYGPVALLRVGTPVLITAFALWANRRPDRGRMLTFSLIAMAGAVMISATSLMVFLPVIALGVAAFKVRKSDVVLPDAPVDAGGRVVDVDTVDGDGAPAARPTSFLERLLGGGAAGGARAGSRRGAAVDEPTGEEVDADDVVDADVLEVDGVPTDAPARPADPAGGRDTDRTPGETDPLAELEAELAAEADADSTGDEEGVDDASPPPGRRRTR